MKKMINVLMILILVLSTASMCYAATPRHISLYDYTTSFSIDEDGLSTYTLTAWPKVDSAPDRVTATVKIINSSGSSVYNQTKTLTYGSVSGRFTGADTKQLSARGQYRMQVTFKCYDGTTLLETIPADVQTAMW